MTVEEETSVVLDPDGNLIQYNMAIDDLIKNAKKELLIITPYLTTDLFKGRNEFDEANAPLIRIVVCPGNKKGSAENVFNGQLDPKILLDYFNRGFEIRQNCSLHSKIVFSDYTKAIVGSANLSSAAFKSGRWETGVLLDDSKNKAQIQSLYNYSEHLLDNSKPVKRREIERWRELCNEYQPKIAKSNTIIENINEELKKKSSREENEARGKGEALMLFADAIQIEEALSHSKDFVGLIKTASQRYRFPDCDYHLDLLLGDRKKVKIWLYARGSQKVIAEGKIVYADYGQIKFLRRSLATRGYSGVGKKIVPIDSGVRDPSELDERKIHVMVIVKKLEKLKEPIKLEDLEKSGFQNPNKGPGGRYIPISTFNKLSKK